MHKAVYMGVKHGHVKGRRATEVFHNMIQRRVFGPKREYRGGWRLCVALDLHFLPYILRVID